MWCRCCNELHLDSITFTHIQKLTICVLFSMMCLKAFNMLFCHLFNCWCEFPKHLNCFIFYFIKYIHVFQLKSPLKVMKCLLLMLKVGFNGPCMSKCTSWRSWLALQLLYWENDFITFNYASINDDLSFTSIIPFSISHGYSFDL